MPDTGSANIYAEMSEKLGLDTIERRPRSQEVGEMLDWPAVHSIPTYSTSVDRLLPVAEYGHILPLKGLHVTSRFLVPADFTPLPFDREKNSQSCKNS